MNDNAKAWVAALRSGEYKQGRLALHGLEPDRWCCLGVACDLYCRSERPLLGRILRQAECVPIFQWPTLVETFDGHDTGLPLVVMSWLGLRDMGGRYGSEGDSLAQLNDRGESFADIATLIESEPEGLFNGV